MKKAVFLNKSFYLDINKNESYALEKEMFREHGIEFVPVDAKNESDVIAECIKADAVLTVTTAITANVIAKLENCKVIVRYGIGYDLVDVNAASKKGIAVCNLPDYCVPDVALHTISLILACIRNIGLNTRIMEKGIWSNSGYPMKRPEGLLLGLISFGKIARKVSEYATSLGFKIIAYDPYVDNKVFEEHPNVRKVEMKELLETSDIISLHSPLVESTFHMINEEAIKLMKEGVVLINCSRGALIDEEHLIDALKRGKVAAVGLDVFEHEPAIESTSKALVGLEKVVCTPHIAYYSNDSSKEQRIKSALSAIAVLSGEIPYNTVNRDVLTHYAT